MPLGESEIGMCYRSLSLARDSMVQTESTCSGTDEPAEIPAWVAGYVKVSLTMEMVMSEVWCSDYEQIYYLCGYQHKIKKKQPKACIP